MKLKKFNRNSNSNEQYSFNKLKKEHQYLLKKNKNEHKILKIDFNNDVSIIKNLWKSVKLRHE